MDKRQFKTYGTYVYCFKNQYSQYNRKRENGQTVFRGSDVTFHTPQIVRVKHCHTSAVSKLEIPTATSMCPVSSARHLTAPMSANGTSEVNMIGRRGDQNIGQIQ